MMVVILVVVISVHIRYPVLTGPFLFITTLTYSLMVRTDTGSFLDDTRDLFEKTCGLLPCESFFLIVLFCFSPFSILLVLQ